MPSVMSAKVRKAKVKNTETGKFITVDLPVGMYLKTDKKTGKDFLQVAYKDGEDIKRQRVAMTLEAYKNAANMLSEERAYIKRFEAAHGKDYKLLDADERAGLDEYRKVQFELAGIKEVSLLEIVKDWVKRNVPKINLTYADLVAKYNEQKQNEFKSSGRNERNFERELYQNKVSIKDVYAVEAEKKIGLIDADFAREVKNNLLASDYKPNTIAKRLQIIKKILNWAVDNQLLQNNPFDVIKLQKAVDNKKGTITAKTGKEILQFTAKKPKNQPFIVGLTLTMFEGIRAAELCRIKFSDIFNTDMTVKETIRLESDLTKTSIPRLIEVTDATRSILTHWAKRNQFSLADFIIPGEDESKRSYSWQKFRMRLGDKFGEALPPNAFRHTALSCKTVLCKNLANVSFEAGNTPDVLKRHYLKLIDKKEAQAYFAIRSGDVF